MKNNLQSPKLAAWQQLPSPQATVAITSLGFDWLIVDLEHSSITTKDAELIFIAAEKNGTKPLARLPSANPYLARRLLDAGATGLLVPVVESLEGLDELAKHCFFPPKGKRGLGLVRANMWGKDLDEYFNNFKPLIIAQIETKTGADNISNISTSEFLDGIMIGPYDLSASLGKPGQFEDEGFKQICKNILNEAKKNKKLIGFHQVEPKLDLLKQRIDEGYDFVAYGTDFVALRHALDGIKK